MTELQLFQLRKEQSRLFEAHLAWLLKNQFSALWLRASISLVANQNFQNAQSLLPYPAQKS
jgi:hypothetical protein